MQDSSPILPAPLRRKIIALIAIKLVVLGALYWMFFGPAERMSLDGASMSRHIISSATSQETEK